MILKGDWNWFSLTHEIRADSMTTNPHHQKFLFDPGASLLRKESLSSVDLRFDLDFLCEALEEGYPGRWAVSEEQWNHFVKSVQTLDWNLSMTPEDFGNHLADVLWNFPDGHLKVQLNGKTLGKNLNVKHAPPSTGANLASFAKSEFWKLSFNDDPQGLIPVVAISAFPQSCEKTWDGFLETIHQVVKAAAPALIVDLRGNIGGDDSKAIEMTSILLGHELDMSWIEEEICESAIAYALQANTYNSIIWERYSSKGLSAPEEIEQKRDAALALAEQLGRSPLSQTRNVQRPSPTNLHREPLAFQGKIFVLTDGMTSSSGEWTCLYLKQHPNTLLVGENTYGMIHFGNSGLLRLPHSGLDITLCMKINKLTDGQFYEKTGLPPDVRVSEADSLEYTLSHLIGDKL